MRPRFQADVNLREAILKATLRLEPTIDFKSSRAAELTGLPDREVLSRAAKQGRILVTHDRRTMPTHFAAFIADRVSPGVLIVPQHLGVRAVAEDLVLIWAATEAEEWTNRIRFLPL
jgi:hypothetical protein